MDFSNLCPFGAGSKKWQEKTSTSRCSSHHSLPCANYVLDLKSSEFNALQRGAPGIATRSKKLLVTKGIATRSKDATRGSWPYY